MLTSKLLIIAYLIAIANANDVLNKTYRHEFGLRLNLSLALTLVLDLRIRPVWVKTISTL